MISINLKRNDIINNKHIDYSGFEVNETILSLLFKTYKDIKNKETEATTIYSEKKGIQA